MVMYLFEIEYFLVVREKLMEEVQQREDVSFCQALCALVTTFVSQASLHMDEHMWCPKWSVRQWMGTAPGAASTDLAAARETTTHKRTAARRW